MVTQWIKLLLNKGIEVSEISSWTSESFVIEITIIGDKKIKTTHPRIYTPQYNERSHKQNPAPYSP